MDHFKLCRCILQRNKSFIQQVEYVVHKKNFHPLGEDRFKKKWHHFPMSILEFIVSRIQDFIKLEFFSIMFCICKI